MGRRAHANQNALEEARTLLEQADRNRRLVEQDLADSNETLGDQTCTNQALTGAKQKCETKCQTFLMTSMKCLLRLRCQKRRPKELWLMLPDWLMSLGVNRRLL